MCTSSIEKYGANPASIQWTVVRGDSATLKIEFLENDEVTYYDNSEWTYVATAYDASGDVLDDIPVVAGTGYIELKVSSDISAFWGMSKYRNIVAELPFDVEITIPGNTLDTHWTPVIGTICVLGDVSPKGSM